MNNQPIDVIEKRDIDRIFFPSLSFLNKLFLMMEMVISIKET